MSSTTVPICASSSTSERLLRPILEWSWWSTNCLLLLGICLRTTSSTAILSRGIMVIDDKGVLRAIDFGCAFVDLPGQRQKRCFKDIEKNCFINGTLPYSAIEVLLCSIDMCKPMYIWATGCIVFELAVCDRLFRSAVNASDKIQYCSLSLCSNARLAAWLVFTKRGKFWWLTFTLLISGVGFALLPVATLIVSLHTFLEFWQAHAA